MSGALRRFWQTVAVKPVAAGFAVTLDGRGVRLPGGSPLVVASAALAEAIAAEWEAIAPGAPFDPGALPLTRIAGTMIERIAPGRAAIITMLVNFGVSDLLLYREEALQAEQAALFDPVLEAFARRHGVQPRVTLALIPQEAEPEERKALTAALEAQDDAGLAALGVLTPALGSLILALGLVEGWVDRDRALDAAFLEERCQMRRWGEDTEIKRQLASRAADVDDAMRFLMLSRQIGTAGA
ncbi:ATP12 family protein [Acidomonas methanolica]|uniref:ATP synthase F1 mitochondrial assembly chaperone ATP12 n=1 Tax=Acidomonas methanolica NBRC 104435 TaxID=1231351 RepID=A0A023D4Y1_ACIMT|nr:ATP12 family protein [Acidomonas methanolica]MBU2654878.1 chaperone, ATP12 [Acidomonas methanolica]GAJ29172.1 ATP synthase F1 mitochondrial assembly chaperone ATP12 [Acidomonas methanolica NBRC 104435]GBQ49864.1 ATP synthase F1 mitochondrial assembly chaperone ATP12 [Acidomonas methanolica]GEK99858.1 ATPase [Acidomonas methanolica NBRC 104435]